MRDGRDYKSLLRDLDHRYLWHPFTQMKEWMEEEPVIIVSGDGALLRDTNGNEYIDANSSIWTNLHGHRHPKITQAIKDQLDRIAHSSFLGLSNVPAIELAERLGGLTGLPRVFYSDDGSTAMEVAIKMALQYWQHCGHPQRKRFIAFSEAYHGDTIGAVSVGGIRLFHEAFRHLTFDVLRASNMEEFKALLSDQVAAVCIEPLIQGAAGMKLWPRGMLRELRRLCDERDVLLIADEVMTGFGRTGTMFACEQEGVAPDLMALAKGLSGGYLPLAATLTSEKIFNAFLGEYHEFKTFFHGHSYTGNQLGCAAALANLQIFEDEKTLENLKSKIKNLKLHLDRCQSLSQVADTRQCGFIGAVELGPYLLEEQIGNKVCRAMRTRGVLTRPIGNVVVIMPPYCITEQQLAMIFDVLTDAVREVVSELTLRPVPVRRPEASP
jgi:adenosylmethionine-8-amino-7-oxononanoate aminotransferase